LRFTLNNIVVQGKYHLILHDIIEEGERNEFVSIIILSNFIEDLAITIPPTTKEFGRLKDITGELLERSIDLLLIRVELNIGMIVRRPHLDKTWNISFLHMPYGLVSSQSANNHLSDGIEDSSLPIRVVELHFLSG
jgi:hypothetical protein